MYNSNGKPLNLFAMLDSEGESMGIVATVLDKNTITEQWHKYYKEFDDDNVDEFADDYINELDPDAERVTYDEINCAP